MIMMFFYACYFQYYEHDHAYKNFNKGKTTKKSSYYLKLLLANNIKCVKWRNIFISSIISIVFISLFLNKVISVRNIMIIFISIFISSSMVNSLNEISHEKQYKLGQFYLKNIIA